MAVILNESLKCLELVRELVRLLRDSKEDYGLAYEDTTHIWPAIDVFIRLLGEDGTEILLEDLLEGAYRYKEGNNNINTNAEEISKLNLKEDGKKE